MRRRDALRAGVALATAGLAGCSDLLTTRSAGMPAVLDDRPDAVYFPTHVEGMKMAGMGTAGDFKFALSYSYPHRFWNVNGTEVEKTLIEDDDDVHLMTTIWDPETGTVLPDAGLSVEIRKDDSLVSQESIYPMLSQPMGFHYGANFELDGDGAYQVTLSVGGLSTRRTGGFRGKFGDGAETTITFDYAQSERDEISLEKTPDRAGDRAAVEPMDMKMPTGRAPESLPGTAVGEATTGDAVLRVASLDTPPEGVDGDGYLAVSARTPHNRMTIPTMGMEATVTRDGETVFDDALTAALDPDLDYHYGAGVAVESGDELELRVPVAPQVARHEGYETAFLEMEPVTLTV